MFDSNGFAYHVWEKLCNRTDKCFVLGLLRWFVAITYFVVYKFTTSNFGSIGVDVETISVQFF